MESTVAIISVSIIPILILAVIIFLVFRLIGMRRKEFDERQMQARGKAYQYGFFAMLVVQILVMFAEGAFDLDMRYVGGSLCLFSGLTVFIVYSAWKDAYFALKQKPFHSLGLCVLVVICNCMGPLRMWREGAGFSEILHSATCLNLMCAFCFLVLCITIILKLLLPENEED